MSRLAGRSRGATSGRPSRRFRSPRSDCVAPPPAHVADTTFLDRGRATPLPCGIISRRSIGSAASSPSISSSIKPKTCAAQNPGRESSAVCGKAWALNVARMNELADEKRFALAAALLFRQLARAYDDADDMLIRQVENASQGQGVDQTPTSEPSSTVRGARLYSAQRHNRLSARRNRSRAGTICLNHFLLRMQFGSHANGSLN